LETLNLAGESQVAGQLGRRTTGFSMSAATHSRVTSPGHAIPIAGRMAALLELQDTLTVPSENSAGD